jgi:uncharacterized cupin superfamily protein
MVTHWDDIEPRVVDVGDLRARWRDLGRAAGSRRLGMRRCDIAPGGRSTPAHVHADEEEIFFVLRGEGLSWQDGKGHPVRPGDAIVHRTNEEAHTLLAGTDGLDVLIFGERAASNLAWLPRAGVMWAGPRWLPDGAHPYAREAAAGALEWPAPEAERPETIVALDDVEARDWGQGDVAAIRRDLGRTAGSVATGLKHVTVAPGALGTPPHCHTAEEELFVVLDGSGELLLGDAAPAPVRPGCAVARPAGTGVAHAFRAGPDGLVLLAYGQRDPSDICFYPRSGKVAIRGLNTVFRVQRVDYWDGEA